MRRHTLLPVLVALGVSLAGSNAAADTEIHRCLLDNGTIAFQEMPCPAPAESGAGRHEAGETLDGNEAPAAGDEPLDYVNPFGDLHDNPDGKPAARPEPLEATLPAAPSQDRAECEKITRDAIDAIDLEMRQAAYTREQGREYLAALLELTEQLRACKQL